MPLDTEIVAWQGLPLPSLGWDASIKDGDSINAGRLDLSLHSGTHADAPQHVTPEGPTIDMLDPGRYMGRARVVRLGDASVIDRATLSAAGLAEDVAIPQRLLVATAKPYDGRTWPKSIPHVDPDAARWLLSLGITLLGVDQPSVDPLDSRQLHAHHILLGGGALILENLRLSHVEPGDYFLAAAPLPIVGGDASPVRALLAPLG